MSPVRRLLLFALAFCLMFPALAHAQRSLWGVTVSFAPVWHTDSFSRHLEGADAVDMQGTTFRAGVSRGGAVHGGWSLLYVRRSLDAGGTIEKDGSFTLANDVRVEGFEAEVFTVPGRIGERVLIGVVFAAGLGTVRGEAVALDGTVVPAKDVLTFLSSDKALQPLVRLELAVGAVVARGFRIRASAGFDWSGISANIAASYYFGDR